MSVQYRYMFCPQGWEHRGGPDGGTSVPDAHSGQFQPASRSYKVTRNTFYCKGFRYRSILEITLICISLWSLNQMHRPVAQKLNTAQGQKTQDDI